MPFSYFQYGGQNLGTPASNFGTHHVPQFPPSPLPSSYHFAQQVPWYQEQLPSINYLEQQRPSYETVADPSPPHPSYPSYPSYAGYFRNDEQSRGDQSTSSSPSPTKRQKVQKLKWEDDVSIYKPMGKTNLYVLSAQLEENLYFLSNHSLGNAKDIVRYTMKRLPENGRVAVSKDAVDTVEVRMAFQLVEALRLFCHKKGHTGKRSALIQSGFNFLATASLFGQEVTTELTKYLTKLLGIGKESFLKAAEHAKEINVDGKVYNRPLHYMHSPTFLEMKLAKEMCVHNFIHSWFGSRVDTLVMKNTAVMVPWGIEEVHPRRCFHERGMKKLYKRFRASPMYSFFRRSYEMKNICKTEFVRMVCPCARDPTPHSCVDTIFSNIDYHCRALLSFCYRSEANRKKYLEDCDCRVCSRLREERQNLIGPVSYRYSAEHFLDTCLQTSPQELVALSCCKKVEHPELKGPNDDEIPRLLHWECARHECDCCGVDRKLLPLFCENLNEMEEKIPIKVWKVVSCGSGESKSTQPELIPCRMKIKDVIRDLRSKIFDGVEHHANDRWTSTIRDLQWQTMGLEHGGIYVDFSATTDLAPGDTSNCQQERHCVLLCASFSYNFRDVEVDFRDNDGNITKTETVHTCTTDHWRFWGKSGGKSKKNDHVFYIACLKHMVDFYKVFYRTELGVELCMIFIWADNCPGQFGCAQNYATVAAADEDWGVLIDQFFPEKQCFKNIVDNIGKVAKGNLKTGEVADDASFSALEAYSAYLRSKKIEEEKKEVGDKAFLEYEANRDPRFLGKGFLTAHKVFDRYVSDSQEDIDQRIANGGDRSGMILTNRLKCNEVSGAQNSKSFWAFPGQPKFRAREGLLPNQIKLDMKFMPCACPICNRLTEIRIWEKKNGQPFVGPRPRCPNYDDCASTTLPVRPPDLPRSRNHVYRGQEGICTVYQYVDVPNENLVAYINPFRNNGKWDSALLSPLINMQLRCRSQTQGRNKDHSITKLLKYVSDRGVPVPPANAAPAVPAAAQAVPVPGGN